MRVENFPYGYDFILRLIEGKWKKEIIFSLGLAPKRYGELMRFINQNTIENKKLTKKVLTEQLNQLIDAKIVTKQVFPSNPPKTVYSLTSAGKELGNFIINLSSFGEQFAQRLASDDFKIEFGCSTQKLLKRYQRDHD